MSIDISFDGMDIIIVFLNLLVLLLIFCILLCCLKLTKKYMIKKHMAIEQIKELSNVKIYEGTERAYFSEDELFREYYKLKRMVNEIKNSCESS